MRHLYNNPNNGVNRVVHHYSVKKQQDATSIVAIEKLNTYNSDLVDCLKLFGLTEFKI